MMKYTTRAAGTGGRTHHWIFVAVSITPSLPPPPAPLESRPRYRSGACEIGMTWRRWWARLVAAGSQLLRWIALNVGAPARPWRWRSLRARTSAKYVHATDKRSDTNKPHRVSSTCLLTSLFPHSFTLFCICRPGCFSTHHTSLGTALSLSLTHLLDVFASPGRLPYMAAAHGARFPNQFNPPSAAKRPIPPPSPASAPAHHAR